MPILLIFMTVAFLFSSDHGINQPSARQWDSILPNCPCKNPDIKGTILNDGWAKDHGNIAVYHKGSSECFRSYPYTRTAEGKSGQQCCYDSKGNLIKSGSGAGTPDKSSTCSGEDNKGIMTIRICGLLSHYINDVRPWKKYGTASEAWKKYNLEWRPNVGENCN